MQQSSTPVRTLRFLFLAASLPMALAAEDTLVPDLMEGQLAIQTDEDFDYEIYRSVDLTDWTPLESIQGDGALQAIPMHEEDMSEGAVFYRMDARNRYAKQGVGGQVNLTYGSTDPNPIMDAMLEMNIAWFYNWGFRPTIGTVVPEGIEFVPMFWGYRPEWGEETLDAYKAELNWIAENDTITHLLGFNEPDIGTQAGMSVETALDLWPLLEATGKRLGSPAPARETAARDDGGWLDRFMTGAAERGYRVDFICLHIYQKVPNIDHVIEYVTFIHEKYGLPIWVTEWSLVDFYGISPPESEQAPYLMEVIQVLEELPFVERHAWFSITDYQEPGQPEPWDMGLITVEEKRIREGSGLTTFLEWEMTVVGEAMRDALTTELPPQPDPEAGNLFLNPGFEDGLEPWIFWSRDDVATGTISSESNNTPSSVYVTAEAPFRSTVTQTVTVVGRSHYTLQGFVRTSGTIDKLMAQLYLDGKWFTAFDLPVSESFQEFRFDDIFIASGVTVEWRLMSEAQGGAEVYFDDLYFGLNPDLSGE
jgi:hypothetical protein